MAPRRWSSARAPGRDRSLGCSSGAIDGWKLVNRSGWEGVPVAMTTDRTPRRPTIPTYFLGRPSILYVERYRRTRDQRR